MESDSICPSVTGLFTQHIVLKIQPCCSRCQNSLIFFLKVYLFLAVLGLRLCVLSLVAVSGGYSAWASHCSGFSCGARALGARASVVVAHGLSSYGSPALEL